MQANVFFYREVDHRVENLASRRQRQKCIRDRERGEKGFGDGTVSYGLEDADEDGALQVSPTISASAWRSELRCMADRLLALQRRRCSIGTGPLSDLLERHTMAGSTR